MSNEILFGILLDVVMSCGDLAYVLSTVFHKWREILQDPEFKRRHHLCWIQI